MQSKDARYLQVRIVEIVLRVLQQELLRVLLRFQIWRKISQYGFHDAGESMRQRHGTELQHCYAVLF